MKSSDQHRSLHICVFCGARPGKSKIYTETAALVGTEIAKSGAGLTYGGGKLGLMGIVAEAALEGGTNILGIMPEFLRQHLPHDGERSRHLLVDDLFQRKAALIRHSDAFVALPGGIGTFDEVIEIIAWRQLSQLDKPIGLLNVNCYFTPMLEMFRRAIDEGFVDKKAIDELVIETCPKTLIERLISLAPDDEKNSSL